MSKTTRTSLITVAACAAAFSMLPARVWGQAFTYGNIVVEKVGTTYGNGSEAITLAEYAPVTVISGTLSFAGSVGATGAFVSVTATGANAMTTSDLSQRDRHVERSVDGRFLTFTGYNGEAGFDDYSGDAAATNPRIVALLKYNLALDTSTRLTDTCDYTDIRGAVTLDGSSFWIAGDNASNATSSGGLRYAVKGASSSSNLSRTQNQGGGQTSDNVRHVGIFGGSLFDCSGSNASIGKSVFAVAPGTVGNLPTSGAQQIQSILPGNFILNGYNGGTYSTTDFVLMDLDPDVAGVDTCYAGCSAPSVALYKFRKNADGTWVVAGSVSVGSAADQVAGRLNDDGSVTVFAGGTNQLNAVTDFNPLSSTLGSSTTNAVLLTAAANFTIGGVDFAPDPVRRVCWGGGNGTWSAGVTNVAFVDTLTANDVWFNNAYTPTEGDSVSFGTAALPLSGNITVAVDGAGVTPTATAFNVLAGGSVTLTGGAVLGMGGLSKTGAGTATVAAFRASGAVVVSGGLLRSMDVLTTPRSVSVAAGAALQVLGGAAGQTLLKTGALTVGGSVTLAVLAGGHGLVDVGTVDLMQLGTSGYAGGIDLGGNDMLIHGASVEAVTAMVAAGLGRTTGIHASLAGTGGRNAYARLGVLVNDDGAGHLLYATFDGSAVIRTDVLVKFTYIGDTDLSGGVDAADLANLLAGMHGGLTGWVNGDVNYDGVVNGTDLGLLLASLRYGGVAFGVDDGEGMGGGSGSGSVGAVPEPGGSLAGVAGLLAAAGCRRPRKASEEWTRALARLSESQIV